VTCSFTRLGHWPSVGLPKYLVEAAYGRPLASRDFNRGSANEYESAPHTRRDRSGCQNAGRLSTTRVAGGGSSASSATSVEEPSFRSESLVNSSIPSDELKSAGRL
jgi:hypothetical protein